MSRRQPRLTLQQRIDQWAEERRLQQLRNAARIRAVAARLPAAVITRPESAPTSREAGVPGRTPASTTTTHAGGLSGCSTQSA